MGHTYAITGTFPVTVTATNGPGGIYSALATQNHLVNDPPPFATLRINAGGADFTDGNGRLWEADQHFVNGQTYSNNVPIANTDHDPLYVTERWAPNLAYAIPAAPSACYTVNLHFAEVYFGAANPAGAATASRSFRRLP